MASRTWEQQKAARVAKRWDDPVVQQRRQAAENRRAAEARRNRRVAVPATVAPDAGLAIHLVAKGIPHKFT